MKFTGILSVAAVLFVTQTEAIKLTTADPQGCAMCGTGCNSVGTGVTAENSEGCSNSECKYQESRESTGNRHTYGY